MSRTNADWAALVDKLREDLERSEADATKLMLKLNDAEAAVKENESKIQALIAALEATRQLDHAQNGEKCELCELINAALLPFADDGLNYPIQNADAKEE
jgi:Tfp pilus assembly protein PilX